MDKPGGSVSAPPPTQSDMDERRASTQTYWQNYLGFQRDITQQRDAALQRIDQQQRYGSLAPEQVSSARSAIEQDYSARMGELQQGPTYQLLQEEFTAQQDFARQQDARAMAQYGTYEYREAAPATREGEGEMAEPGGWYRLDPQRGGGRGDDLTGPNWTRIEGEPPPRPESTVFQGSLEDYYGEQFGSDISATGTPARSSQGLRQRAAAGAGVGRAVGVGRVYPTY